MYEKSQVVLSGVNYDADPRVMEFSPSILSLEETQAMCKRINDHFAQHGFAPWAMEVERQFAGSLGFDWITRFEPHVTPCVENGYRLFRLSRHDQANPHVDEHAPKCSIDPQ